MIGRHLGNPVVARRLAAVRCGYGAVWLLLPSPVLLLLGANPSNRRARQVARLLGARQLTQGVLSAGDANRATTVVAAEIDLVHAASMIVLAVVDRRHRRAGCLDAALATGFAAASLAADHTGASRTRRPSALAHRRDATATWITDHTLPATIRGHLLKPEALRASSSMRQLPIQ